jgi:hypothetical protein
MTDYESEPVEYWEYRNVQCALYCLRVPENSRWIGYVQFADEWVEVLDEDGHDPSDDPEQMKTTVEDEVDRRIRKAIEDEAERIDFPFDEPVNPDPGVDPIDPNPTPLPPNDDDDPFGPGPTWIAGVPVFTDRMYLSDRKI